MKHTTKTVRKVFSGAEKGSEVRSLRLLALVLAVLGCSCFENSPTGQSDVPGPMPVLGNYRAFFGDIHNHSTLSDGMGTPREAYAYAKDVAKVDYLGLADHCYDLNNEKWEQLKSAAAAYREDTAFVAFYGFEWSSDVYGHVSVVNSGTFCSVTDSATDSFEELVQWLDSHGEIAFFNHPQKVALPNEFNHFSTPPTQAFVGIELWNKHEFSRYFYNDGYYSEDNFRNCYDEALVRGWRIGAGGANDSHSPRWGDAVEYKMAILATERSRDSLYAALKARRFYSTLDRNIVMSFRVNGFEMGSTVVPGKNLLEIELDDQDMDESYSEIILFDRNHNELKTWNPYAKEVLITDTLEMQSGDYYYVKVAQVDDDQAVSSPVWVE